MHKEKINKIFQTRHSKKTRFHSFELYMKLEKQRIVKQ